MMIFGMDIASFRTLSQIVFVVFVWEVAKRMWQAFFGNKKRLQPQSDVPDEALHVKVPPEPHLEMVFDPPNGLHCSNPKNTYSFESECASGTYLCFHSPTGEGNREGPGGFDYEDYFKGKSRLWELRIHFKFHKPPGPDNDLFFGIELEDYVPLNPIAAKAQSVIIKCIQQAVGGVYHAVGDDPKKTIGECEQPACVLPLWAFDQFIVTPEGEEPPSLTDPNFSNLGKRRYQRIAEYAQEIKELESTLRAGPTYTFAFWGNSRFLDALNWKVVGIPLVTPEDFDKFAGKPPVHAVIYSVRKPRGDAPPEKHYRSRKRYLFKAALWSSLRRPPASRIASLLGSAESPSELSLQLEKEKKSKKKSMRRICTPCTARTTMT